MRQNRYCLSNTKISVSDIGNENRKTSVSVQKNLIGRALLEMRSPKFQASTRISSWRDTTNISSFSSFERVGLIHCQAALDPGAGVGQPFDVTSSRTVRPRTSRGGRWIGQWRATWSAVCCTTLTSRRRRSYSICASNVPRSLANICDSTWLERTSLPQRRNNVWKLYNHRYFAGWWKWT